MKNQIADNRNGFFNRERFHVCNLLDTCEFECRLNKTTLEKKYCTFVEEICVRLALVMRTSLGCVEPLNQQSKPLCSACTIEKFKVSIIHFDRTSEILFAFNLKQICSAYAFTGSPDWKRSDGTAAYIGNKTKAKCFQSFGNTSTRTKWILNGTLEANGANKILWFIGNCVHYIGIVILMEFVCCIYDSENACAHLYDLFS